MHRYLCLQRGLDGGSANEPPSPQQMQDMYAAFQVWQAKFSQNLIDLGGRLGQGQMVNASADVDGPSVEIKELAGGYMIVQAASIEQACEIAQGCPGLVGPGSAVEVIEILGQ